MSRLAKVGDYFPTPAQVAAFPLQALNSFTQFCDSSWEIISKCFETNHILTASFVLCIFSDWQMKRIYDNNNRTWVVLAGASCFVFLTTLHLSLYNCAIENEQSY